MVPFAAAILPRKSRQHITLLVFLSLILLSSYIFLVHYTDRTDTSILLRSSEVRLQPPHARLPKSHRIVASRIREKEIQLTNAQELAAVSSFLASLPQNQLPSSIDPLSPIDPQLVLDFDTRTPRASEEVQAMVEDVWLRNPVFLYSKRYSSASRKVKMILDDFHLMPSPTIIDVDTRDDADVLIPLLHRLTSTDAFPVLIVAGKVVGTSQEVLQMDHDGTLQQLIIESGATVNGAKLTKRKH